MLNGGEHYQLLEDHKLLSEAEAVVMFIELMEVLKYCHDKGVMHRELKPENILLATNSKSSPIKLSDFGLASYIRPDHCWFKNEEMLLGDEGQFGSLEDSLPEQLIPMNCDFIVNSSNVVCSDVQRHLSPYVYLQNVIFFLLAGATGCSPSTGLSYRSSASSDEECSTPIASMPSFAFFAPCTPDEQENSLDDI
ncbi:Calcium/calmodulin-dependent protein kinase type II alpha chain [Nymphaea thermarum]|nr:Calcium/calmodulin-dependent protein kinase type II alpha chain [Nymphaea thermarum]